jgi:hypothetical protein
MRLRIIALLALIWRTTNGRNYGNSLFPLNKFTISGVSFTMLSLSRTTWPQRESAVTLFALYVTQKLKL